jgi:WD40 repeat protein
MTSLVSSPASDTDNDSVKETTLAQCRRCGAPLHGGVPGGLCAACFGGGLFTEEPEGLPFTRIGDYELLEEIGRGGMGLVYRARQISLNRPAAVKLILTGPLASVVERQRFVAEASAAAALEHSGIVAVYEAGEEDGQPFFAMQLIEGASLSTRLSNGPRFALREAAELMRRTALAIQHAHERGFLHRDLKPGNVLLDHKGAPHVTDFGLARRVDDDSRLTLTGAAVGTPSYMAPEQTDTRRPPTTAVDVYSLGAIFYELLAGRPPFAEKSLPELFVAIREKEPASISAIRSEMDRDLDIICRKCLEKDPSRRYRTAQALADDLQHWMDGVPIAARAVGKAERLWRWCRRRPAIAGLAAAVVVLFFTGLVLVLWQWDRANREAHTAKEALQRSEESLWQANVSEARARRISRERGQRLEALRSLKAAAAHRTDIALRNEAIAAMALPDLGEPRDFAEMPPGGKGPVSDGALRRLACMSDDQHLHVWESGPAPPPVMSIAGVNPLVRAAPVRGPWLQAFNVSRNLEHFLLMHHAADAQPASDRCVELRHFPVQAEASSAAVFEHCHAAAFSPDGASFCLVREGKLEVRHAATGELQHAAECQEIFKSATVSPDGGKVVMHGLNARQAELWSLSPPARLGALPALPEPVEHATWHPWDGTLFLSCAKQLFHVRPLVNRLDPIAAHEREGVYAAPHPSGLFVASVAWDGVIRCNAPGVSGDLLRTSGFRLGSFSEDGRRLLVHRGKRVGVCEVAPFAAWRPVPPAPEGSAEIYALHFSPDNRLLAIVSRDSVRFCDPATLRTQAREPMEQATAGAWMPGGVFYATEQASGVAEIMLTTRADGSLSSAKKTIFTNKGEKYYAGVALTPDGGRMLIHNSSSLAAYDLKTRQRISHTGGLAMLSLCNWSPDGRWMAAGYWNNQISGGSDAVVIAADDGKVAVRLPAGNCAPVFTPDGRRLVVGSTHEYVEWEAGTWRELRRHPREASGLDMGKAAFSAAANLMALQASETVIRLLRLDTGEELARLEPPVAAKITHMGFSPDGRWLAVSGRQTVSLWDLQTVRETLREMGLDW